MLGIRNASRNIVTFGAGMLACVLGLHLLQHATGYPHAMSYGWLPILLVGFIAIIVLIRIIDRVFAQAFARSPLLQQFLTGIIVGVLIFAVWRMHA